MKTCRSCYHYVKPNCIKHQIPDQKTTEPCKDWVNRKHEMLRRKRAAETFMYGNQIED